MIRILVPGCELWDEKKNEFIYTKDQSLVLEHSLVSVSKWESKWKIPFLGDQPKTREQTIDYIRCMTITQNVDPTAYNRLTKKNIDTITSYIEDSQSATWFSETDKKGRRSTEQITSELIYYWMVAFQIPMECQKWHFNRLLTLIRICSIKNQPKKKMSKREIMRRNTALNEARRKKFNTKG